MTWHLQGSYFEHCPCDQVCPCITSAFTAPADVERCLTVLAFHIDSGQVEGVEVSGLTVGMFIDSPRVMAEGNWRVGLFMDAAASQEQAGKLAAVFSGQLGGPPQMFAAMAGENLGVETAPMQYADDGRHHRIQIGDVAEIEIEDFVPPQNPGGEVYQLTNIMPPPLTELARWTLNPTPSTWRARRRGQPGTRCSGRCVRTARRQLRLHMPRGSAQAWKARAW